MLIWGILNNMMIFHSDYIIAYITEVKCILFFSLNSIENILYVFEVSSVCPNHGSIAGNTNITLYGLGFPDDVSVVIGGSDCTVTDATSTELTCTTADLGKTHHIRNNASDPCKVL